MDLTGKTIGRYRINLLLGKGGMGEVYKAFDPLLRRAVALKRVSPRLNTDPQYRKLLLKEAERAGTLSSDRIARILDAFESDGELFVVMEFVEGTNLRARLDRPMPIPEFLRLATECLEALAVAHQAGIVHRDIKPENIMITAGGAIKICDFGLARNLPVENGRTISDTEPLSHFAGTPAYMSPEAILGRPVDGRTDIFSLGIVFYEALTATHPFCGPDNRGRIIDAMLHSVPREVSALNTEASEQMSQIIAKMLCRTLEDRYGDVNEVLADIRSLQRPLPDTRPAPVARPSRKRTGVLLAGLMILFLLAGVIIYRPTGSVNPQARGKTLVILPFRSSAPGQTQAYTDGLIETVTAKLGQLTLAHQFQIVSANEIRTRRVTTVSDAYAEFGGELIIEGDVQRSNDTIRINYSIVDSRTRKQLGSDSITFSNTSPFEAQDRVVNGLVRLLGLQLAAPEKALLVNHGTQAVGAYEFYLQGRGYLQNYDRPENLDNAISEFRQSLKMDPNYALAYAGIGEAFWRKYSTTKEVQWIAMARQNCERALAIDESAAAPHACLGTVETGVGNYSKAILEFQHALERSPADDSVFMGLAAAYDAAGLSTQAEETYRRVIQLHPQYWGGYSRLGGYYFTKSRYADAERMFAQVVALLPDSYRGFSNLGGVYFAQNKTAEAVAAYEKSMTLRRNYTAASNLGTLYFYNSEYKRAEANFEDALKINAADYKVWGNLALTRRFLGDTAKAKEPFERAIEKASAELTVNPSNAKATMDLAVYQAAVGRKAEARNLVDKALAIQPENALLLLEAAAVYSDAGERTDTLQLLSRAVRHGLSLEDLERNVGIRNLRDDPRYKAIEEEVKNNRRKGAR